MGKAEEQMQKPEDSPPERETSRRSNALQFAREVLRIEATALSDLADRFDEAAFDRALQYLVECRGRVVCTGMGKSGIIGKKLAGTLASTGSPAFFLHPAEAGHGDLGMLVEGDVLIAISHSGGTKEVVALLPAVKRLGVPLIVLVGNSDSVLAKEADVAIDAGIEKEACPLGLVPTASTTAALAMGDALAMALLDERGYSADDLAVVHPRGGIGQRLLRVRQVMHREAEVPRIDATEPLASVVAEMSSKGLGMTSVVDYSGTLIGIITDGDLRRLLERGPHALEGSARDFMTQNPTCVRAEALATEALRLMEEGKITSLMVLDQDGRPEGVVHLHDLWRTQMI
jgi:arabinose-5-phosphate isomerase